jgi:hypothetical protein
MVVLYFTPKLKQPGMEWHQVISNTQKIQDIAVSW